MLQYPGYYPQPFQPPYGQPMYYTGPPAPNGGGRGAYVTPEQAVQNDTPTEASASKPGRGGRGRGRGGRGGSTANPGAQSANAASVAQAEQKKAADKAAKLAERTAAQEVQARFKELLSKAGFTKAQLSEFRTTIAKTKNVPAAAVSYSELDAYIKQTNAVPNRTEKQTPPAKGDKTTTQQDPVADKKEQDALALHTHKEGSFDQILRRLAISKNSVPITNKVLKVRHTLVYDKKGKPYTIRETVTLDVIEGVQKVPRYNIWYVDSNAASFVGEACANAIPCSGVLGKNISEVLAAASADEGLTSLRERSIAEMRTLSNGQPTQGALYMIMHCQSNPVKWLGTVEPSKGFKIQKANSELTE